MLANLGRLLAVAVKWATGHGQPPADAPRRWTGELSAAVDQALALAKDYGHFEVCFQGFHKGRYAADVLSPTLIRFSVPGSELDRQVSAYQKGLRPREGRFAGQRAAHRPQEPRMIQAFEHVIRTCRPSGSLAFEYGDPWDLWRAKHVHYLIVARDHWRWVEPSNRVAIVEFEPFAQALERAANLRDAVGELLTYDWLPVEGRDFQDSGG